MESHCHLLTLPKGTKAKILTDYIPSSKDDPSGGAYTFVQFESPRSSSFLFTVQSKGLILKQDQFGSFCNEPNDFRKFEDSFFVKTKDETGTETENIMNPSVAEALMSLRKWSIQHDRAYQPIVGLQIERGQLKVVAQRTFENVDTLTEFVDLGRQLFKLIKAAS